MSRRSSSLEMTLPAGMRATRATRAMLALLRSQAGNRMSAAEVEAALARVGVAVNRVTVFRALDRLAQAGLLQRRVDDDRITRYQWRSDAAKALGPSSGAVAVGAPAGAASEPAATATIDMAQFLCVQCKQRYPLAMAGPAWAEAVHALTDALLHTATGQLHAIELQGLCTPCQRASQLGAAPDK